MIPPVLVVSDAGPFMVLAKLNVLHLLKHLYGHVRYARSVYDEIVVEGMRRGHADAATLSVFLTQMQWVADEVDPATIPADLQSARLDSGERDTLALALSLGDCRVLIDEPPRASDFIPPASLHRTPPTSTTHRPNGLLTP